MKLRVLSAFALMAGVGLAGSPASADDSEWLRDEGGVLQMMLAHEEKAGPDGGVLTIDRTRKLVTWEGAGGEHACRSKVESSFDGIKSVKDNGQNAGFVVDFGGGKNKKMTFLPLPLAQWFVMQWKVKEGKFGQTIPEGTMRGPDGQDMAASGGAASAGPTIKHEEIPKKVVDETRHAMDELLQAIGRHP